MHTLLFATNNAHKVAEINKAVGSSLQIISLKEAGILVEIPEPYDTLHENASAKSAFIHRLTGKDCFSEDTGLITHALEGAPGVKSARYAGEQATYAQNTALLLHNLLDKNDRRAYFQTVISLIWMGKEYFFEGECNGSIARAAMGDAGFGYDPIFIPDGSNKSFAQMSAEEKNKYSHRAKAVNKLVTFLMTV